MIDSKDFLAHERGTYEDGSLNAMLKELIQGIRYIRSIPGEKIRESMPPYWKLEADLQHYDSEIGNPKREYIQEIMEVLDNEPEWDGITHYLVCKMDITDGGEVRMIRTENLFQFKIIAEEWIKDSGVTGQRYSIVEYFLIEQGNPH